MNKYSFKKAMGQIKNDDTENVKKEIMGSLNILTRQAWSNRLYGKVIPGADEKEAIENIFKNYGVKGNIWGGE